MNVARVLVSLTVAGATALTGIGVTHPHTPSSADLSASLCSLSSHPEEPDRYREAADRLAAAHQSLYVEAPMREDLRQVAQRYAVRAAAGEFEYETGPGDGPDYYTEFHGEDGNDGPYTVISRMTPGQAHALAQSYEELDAENLDPFLRERFNVTASAVSTDGEHIYEATHTESIPGR